jgi:hypothetical protein
MLCLKENRASEEKEHDEKTLLTGMVPVPAVHQHRHQIRVGGVNVGAPQVAGSHLTVAAGEALRWDADLDSAAAPALALQGAGVKQGLAFLVHDEGQARTWRMRRRRKGRRRRGCQRERGKIYGEEHP